MGYAFEGKYDANKRMYIGGLYHRYSQDGTSFNTFQRMLMTRGLSYNRKVMLADWNRAKIVERTRRGTKMVRQAWWYDHVALPTMEKLKITPTTFFAPTKFKPLSEFEDSDEYLEWLEFLAEEKKEKEERYDEQNWS